MCRKIKVLVSSILFFTMCFYSLIGPVGVARKYKEFEQLGSVFSSSVTYASELDALYVWSESVETTTKPTETNNALELTCGGAVLMEQETGQVLYEYNPHEKLRPASVTKVMSLLLIMEALDEGRITLEDKIPCSENAASMGGSQIWLDVREELSVNDMLKAICVVSANESGVQFWQE